MTLFNTLLICQFAALLILEECTNLEFGLAAVNNEVGTLPVLATHIYKRGRHLCV